jgi:calcineurin-like phosphoesterase family protein
MNSRTFVIADTHFNDTNIIRFCHRPFSSVADMNSALIDNWNSVVEPCDTVWILGDFFKFESLCDYPADEFGRDFKDILHKLHGHKNLIKGNHDIKSDSFYTHHFDFYSHYPILLNSFFLLSHEPLQLSETTPYFNIYGHVHNDTKYKDNKTSRCVSVERINYRPLLLDDAVQKDYV